MKSEYTTSDFNFSLPKKLIAQMPAHPRDHARLLIYDRKTKSITDDHFYNLDKYLPKNTTLVLNNSKVEKCRLRFGSVEIFVLETINPTTLRALVRPGRKFKKGSVKIKEFSMEVDDIDKEGIRTIRLDRPLDDPAFDSSRLTPLPPYIAQNEKLAEEYQTVYADPLGSKAAPTAGLHFTSSLIKELKTKHRVAELTLHVGMGTFAPVKSEDLSKHIMHKEDYVLSSKTARLLDIFILPGFKFKTVDALITNFHLPKSTLLMLVSAFMGSVDEMHRVYRHAIENNYRFYSFGDAMLIL
jgi:S-adenosylmethionine:tRNA ribosyltransferase-isomerase